MHRQIATIIASVLLLSFGACEQKPKTPLEKVEDKVNDGLDRRPAEKVRDAVEDAADKTKDAVK